MKRSKRISPKFTSFSLKWNVKKRENNCEEDGRGKKKKLMHVDIHMHIYIYICVCGCIYIYIYKVYTIIRSSSSSSLEKLKRKKRNPIFYRTLPTTTYIPVYIHIHPSARDISFIEKKTRELTLFKSRRTFHARINTHASSHGIVIVRWLRKRAREKKRWKETTKKKQKKMRATYLV